MTKNGPSGSWPPSGHCSSPEDQSQMEDGVSDKRGVRPVGEEREPWSGLPRSAVRGALVRIGEDRDVGSLVDSDVQLGNGWRLCSGLRLAWIRHFS